MIPTASTALPVANGGQNVASASAKADQAVSGQAKSSAGVASPSNARLETSVAIDPSRQAAVAPRLRDQETAERTDRSFSSSSDGPTGPPPSFDETPLQRAARVIFDPPEAFLDVASDTASYDAETAAQPATEDTVGDTKEITANAKSEASSDSDLASRRAEAAFEQAREITDKAANDVDVAL